MTVQARQILKRGISILHRRLDKRQDIKFNIETSEVINITDLTDSIDFTDYEIDELYSATPGGLFKDLHSPVSEKEKRESTYIDVGCGKGRALIKSLQFGFKNLIGVEFVPSIAEQAIINVNKTKDSWVLDATCGVVCHDIRTFQYPDTNLILYLYNPFDPTVFEVFLSNLLEDLRMNPRKMTLIYYHSHCESILDDCDELERVKYNKLTRMKLKTLSIHAYGAWRYKHNNLTNNS